MSTVPAARAVTAKNTVGVVRAFEYLKSDELPFQLRALPMKQARTTAKLGRKSKFEVHVLLEFSVRK